MDFIETFLAYSEGVATPDRFRLWCGIAAVAGAMERRVCTITVGRPAYPNLFTLLVAPPGIGKTEAISMVEELWIAAGDFIVSPNNLTKAALVDAVAEAHRNIHISETELLDFHSLLICAPEFGVLVPAHDLEFLSVINYLWDNPTSYREKRRGMKTLQNPEGEVDIALPQINILGGVQPGYLSTLLPETAWTMGTMSRAIMIYSAHNKIVPIFNTKARDKALFGPLVEGLQRIGKMIGVMEWTPEARQAVTTWYENGLQPIPRHSKLISFCARRLFTTIKLSVVSSASRGNSMVIELEDFLRARSWLLEAETAMPDVFRDMSGRSDRAVIDELYYFVWQVFVKEKSPLHESRLLSYLSSRIPMDKVDTLMDLVVSMGMLIPRGNGLYEPSPDFVAGVE